MATPKRRKPKLPTRKYRVWLEQINQTYVDVRAVDCEEADIKAIRKWRREYGFPRVTQSQSL